MSYTKSGTQHDSYYELVNSEVLRGYSQATGKSKKSKKKYFTKIKEDKIKESPLLKMRGHFFISPWIYVGLENRDKPGWVQTYVLSYLKTTIEELKVGTKKREDVFKKKIFCYAMREYAEYKLECIGTLINTHHANVLHHHKDVKDKLDIKDEDYTKIIEDLNRVLKHKL